MKFYASAKTPAKLLHTGPIDQAFVEQVEQVERGELPGMTFEGVVCKGPYTSPGTPAMFKIKHRAWVEKLKSFCADDAELFKRML